MESERRPGRRNWLLLPLLGLIPLVAAVLASELPNLPGFGGSPTASNAPRAAAPAVTPNVTISATATPVLTTQAIPAPPVATSAPTASTSSVGAAAPAATAAPATVSVSVTGPFTAYRVQPGDTVKFVAQMYGVTPASIANASGLSNPDQLRVGQVLTIPNQSGWLYRVQPGETLDQISARTGVSSDTIATVSQLTVASVRAGDVILIPDLTAAKSK